MLNFFIVYYKRLHLRNPPHMRSIQSFFWSNLWFTNRWYKYIFGVASRERMREKWADNSLFGWLNLRSGKWKCLGLWGRRSEALMKSNWMRRQKPEKKVASDFLVRYHFIDWMFSFAFFVVKKAKISVSLDDVVWRLV